MTNSIQGIIAVAHTPFTDQDAIDWDSLQRQVAWAFERGVDGVCTGMVSEIPRLTSEERMELTHRLTEWSRGRGLFVASVGGESTRQAIVHAHHAEASGCDAVMAIPPLAASVSADQLLDYFSAIADCISIPVIVQDASGYVGQTIPMKVYLDLLDRYGEERILFKPEASPVGTVISALREATHGKAQIFEGSGGNLLIDSYRRGIVGAIPGMEFLDGVIAVWRALRDGNEERAYRVYFPLCALVTLQLQAGLDGFLAVEKYIMRRRGLFQTEHRRGPLAWKLDAETRQEVDRLLDHLEAAVSDD